MRSAAPIVPLVLLLIVPPAAACPETAALLVIEDGGDKCDPDRPCVDIEDVFECDPANWRGSPVDLVLECIP